MKEEGLTDPYFTDKDGGKVQVQRKIMLHDAHSVMEDTVEGVPEHHESYFGPNNVRSITGSVLIVGLQ